MEKNNCNLCKSDNSKTLFKLNNFEVPLNIVRCRTCGLIYQDPRPDRDVIKTFYSKDYYTGAATVSYYTDFKQDEVVAAERLKAIETLKSPGKLLDVGCYAGSFLTAARKRGWDPYGVDISPFIVKQAQGKGLNVSCGEVQDAGFKGNFFDLITLFEVIEHFFNPLETLTEIRRILKDDGLLVIQTANMDSLRAKLLEPQKYYFLPIHLYYFTKRTMGEMLREAGFEILKMYNGSEFDIFTELKLFKGKISLGRLLLRKLLNKIQFRGFTLNSVMVVYARKVKK